MFPDHPRHKFTLRLYKAHPDSNYQQYPNTYPSLLTLKAAEEKPSRGKQDELATVCPVPLRQAGKQAWVD